MFCTVCATHNPITVAHCTTCGSGIGGDSLAPHEPPATNVAWRRPTTRSRRVAALRLLYIAPLALLLAAAWVVVDARRDLQADAAAWYERAELAAAHGRFDQAAAAFAAAGEFRDAAARRQSAEADLAPLRDAYLDGVTALDAGNLDGAIERFRFVASQLPDYEDTHLRLADARQRKADALRADVDTAEARRDWLGAERALTALVATDPGDQAAVERLALVRQNHAPIILGRDHQLWLVGPDGADERLLTDELSALWPAWSPDRSHVAFISIDTDDPAATPALYVVDTDGSGLRRLADDVASHTAPVWSPDGDRLAFTSFAAFDNNRNTGTIGVRMFDLASGQETDLSGPDLPIAFNPTWSPRGDQVAFVSKHPRLGERPQNAEGDILLVDLATAAQRNLTTGAIPDAWSVHWSPTSDQLLVYSVFGDTWYEPPITGLHLLDAAIGLATEVPTEAGVVTAPAWSPDGSRFAYVQDRTTLRIRHLAGDEEAVPSSDELAGEISWSPAGDALIAAALDGSRGALLVEFDPTTPPDARLLSIRFDDDQPFYGSPQWAPPNPAAAPSAPTISGTGLDAGSR